MALDELIHRYLEDRSALDPVELSALVEGLKHDPQRAVALREQLLIDDLLGQKLAIDRRNFLAQVEQRVADYQRDEQQLDKQVAELRALAEAQIEQPLAWSGTSPWVKAILAASALALLAAVLLVPRLTTEQPGFVAKLTAFQGDVTLQAGQRRRAAALNEALLAGHTIHVAAGASASVTYDDATAVHISGDSAVTFDIDARASAKRVTIGTGEIAASVEPQSIGMRFATPHAVATVLGTELRIAVDSQETRLDVSHGQVRLESLEGDGRLVSASETAIAAAGTLDVRPLAWPDDRGAVAYLYSPLEALDPGVPLMVARNPATGNLRETQLLPRGSALIALPQMHLELSGGYFVSDEAGGDIVAACQGRTGFALEVIFTPAVDRQEAAATIVAFGGADDAANFHLAQKGQSAMFFLRAGDPAASVSLSAPLPTAGKTVHLAVCFHARELVAYLDGAPVARCACDPAVLAAWHGGPLTVGADGAGRNAWQGVVHGLALYSRALSPREVERNRRSFGWLSLERP